MGVGIGNHRSLDAVTTDDFTMLAKQLGVGFAQAKQEMAELAEALVPALMASAHDLDSPRGMLAEELAEQLVADSQPRRELVLRACS